MKNLIRIFLVAGLLLTTGCNSNNEDINLNPSVELENFEDEFGAKEFEAMEKSEMLFLTITREEAYNPILGKVSGRSTLIRGRRGIWARYKAEKLTPGHAYTLWWVIWNKPQNCITPNQCIDQDFFTNASGVEVELLYAAGKVANRKGKATFFGRLRAGDTSQSINEYMFGLPSVGGLQTNNTFGSEVHLVIRSHGPAIDGQVYDQITSYEGGCEDPLAILPFTEIPDEIGECADIEFSIFGPIL